MKTSRTLATVFVFAIIAVALAAVVLSQPRGLTTTTPMVATSTGVGNSSTVVYESRVTGTYTAVSYFEGDEEEISRSTITVTSGNVTTYSYGTVVVSSPHVTTLGTRAYSTASSANDSSVFTVSTTSLNQSYAPSGFWTVTVCTYGG